MKNIYLVLFILSFYTASSQSFKKKPFYTASFHTSLSLNEDYTLFDDQDGEYLLDLSGFFIRNGVGYQFSEHWRASVNIGLDFHTKANIQALPSFINVQYNFNESLFLNTSLGTLFKPSSNFEKGDYFSIGLGANIIEEDTHSMFFTINFDQKKFTDYQNPIFQTLSLSFGVSFF